MLALIWLVLISLTLSHWFVEPLAALLGSLLSLAWLGWGGLLLVLWLLAGGESAASAASRQAAEPPADQG
jgi:hypothetical protein